MEIFICQIRGGKRFQVTMPHQESSNVSPSEQSDSILDGCSDQKNQESKGAPYGTARYTTLLEAKEII